MFPEVPPPGAGVVTATFTRPAVAISAAAIAAVTCVALTSVVVLAAPLNLTTEPGTKPVPFTVSVKATPPAVALGGTIEISVGTGLLMVKVCAFETPPPGAGFVTVTLTVPAVAMSAAVMAAVTCVPLTNVVVRFAPLNCTVAPLAKPVPFTVSVKPTPPVVTLAGEREVMVRFDGLLIVKGKFPEVPPPGAGFVTATLTVPAVAISAAVIAAVI